MYGNCLLYALIEKIKHPQNEIYIIGPKHRLIRDCHYVWKTNKGQVLHFTRKNGTDALCEYWFQGDIQKLNSNMIEEFKGRRFL